MKKVVLCSLGIMCLAGVIIFLGYILNRKEEGAESMNVEEITYMEVSFFKDNNTSVMIDIDFVKNEREYSEITKEIKKEVSQYTRGEELLRFINARILKENRENSKQDDGKSDDKKIIWSIRIRSGEEVITFNNVNEGTEDYPEYWEDLMLLLE